MILVAGGTGILGSLVVESLAAGGSAVRVLTRDAERARLLGGEGVEICVGDVCDPAAVRRHVAGASTVVSAIQGFAGTDPRGVRAVDQQGNSNLISAAAATGAAHFVLVSVHGAAADHPMELARMKHRAEEELRASGLAFTIIRPTAFLETWMAVLAGPITKGGRALVFGTGNNPINFVGARDVAVLTELAARSPSLRGEVLDIGGPEDLTLNQFVAILMAAKDRTGPVRHVPLAVMRLMAALLGPVKPGLASVIQVGVVMDTTDMTFSGADARARLPEIPVTRLADLV